MSYVFSPFVLEDALAGKLVGYDNGTYDLTGWLKAPGPNFKVVISGKELYVDGTGVVKKSSHPVVTIGSTLKMVSSELDTSTTTGVKSRGKTDPNPPQGATATDEVNLSAMQPRDHFAMTALRAIMDKMDHPESADDATIIAVSRSAYRWAHGMVEAAYDARYGKYKYSVKPGEIQEIEVDTDSIETNTDKILYNMSQYMKHAAKKGLPIVNASEEIEGEQEGETVKKVVPLETTLSDVKKVAGQTIYKGIPIVGAGTTAEEEKPVVTKLHSDSEIKEVKKVTEMPTTTHVTVDGTPQVRITNMPTNLATSEDVNNAKTAVIGAMPSTDGLATSSDVSSAESAIISAMPSCKYTPPSENSNNGGNSGT